jgi:PEP-CTERM motif
MRRIWLLSAVVLMVAWSSPAKAGFTNGLIDVDFNFAAGGTQSGAAVIGASGDVWNGQSDYHVPSAAVLNLATGSPSSGVSYSLSGFTQEVDGGSALAFTQYGQLMRDGYIVGPGNTATISFSGLTAFQPYDLYFYSSFADASGTDVRTTTFTIAGNSLTATTVGAPLVFVEGNNYVHFRSQAANANGQMTVTIQGVGGLIPAGGPDLTGGIVNGFQITPVPEPATMVLFGIGGLGALSVGLRREKF